ncbi:MAG TPA: FHA domain-containing protein, partial [Polyangiaceae bacterium]
MIPGFGKQSVTIGSAPHCEIRLGGPGVMPEHARIVHQGGTLVFINGTTGQSFANGAPLGPGAEVSFDFRTQFAVGQAAVPNAHPALALMLMSRGSGVVTPGQVSCGREPSRSNIVIGHANVSGLHATVNFSPLSVLDHGSTSGTWIGQTRLPANQPNPLEPHALLGMGPVPVSLDLAHQLAQQLMAEQQGASSGRLGAATAEQPNRPVEAQAPPSIGAPAESTSGSRPKHKTVIGQVQFGSAGEATVKSIGRTADNDIKIDSPQVSSRHALLHSIDGQLFIEDRGSANGTYVRGQRIPRGERVPVSSGEKVFIGPMPLLLQVHDREVAVVVEDVAQWAGRALYEIEAWDLVLQVTDRDNPGELKTLIDHISFKALPGDLIALMGPSGSGKTTLLLTLNGYLPPTFGQVRINGEDLYAIYDALRGSIGYVPQDDIVHPELTVWEAVRYSAKFRLPPDYSEEDIDQRVGITLAQLGLEAVAHLQIGRPE